MTVILGADHDVVFFGPTANPKCVRWWAEGGQLNYEDSRDNTYAAVSVRDFLLRLQGISDMLGNGKTKENEGFMHPDELARHRKFIEEALLLAKKAKAQGDAAVVQFAGRADRIARVHHYGEQDRVAKNGPMYDYPERQLLGIPAEDADLLRDVILRHLHP